MNGQPLLDNPQRYCPGNELAACVFFSINKGISLMPQILAPQAKALENVSVAIVVNPPAEIPDTTSLFLSTSSSSSARYKAPAHASSTSYTPHLQKRKKKLF